MQDLADQEGDCARGRMILPLFLSDWIANCTVAIPVAAWWLIYPSFGELAIVGYAAPVAIGGIVVFRILTRRAVTADKLTWKVWCLWAVSLYALPLCKNSKDMLQVFP